MAQYGVFRSDPGPTQTAPHAPIPAQGGAPPIRGPLAIAAVALIVGAWPATADPRPAQLQPRSNFAPLTLAYGDRPPVAGALSPQEVALIATWPADKEPRLPRLTPASTIAPLTLAYGNAPPITGPLSPAELAILQSWPLTAEPRLPRLLPASLVAPLTLTYGNQPQIIGPLTAAEIAQLVAAWQPAFVLPLALEPTAAWNVPVVGFIPFTAPPLAILGAWQPAWLAPPRPAGVAPLTLTYGSAPAIVGPLTPFELAELLAAWQPPFVPPSQLQPTAGWNIPLSAYIPGPEFPASILTAWQPPWLAPPRPVGIAPLTLAYGAQPPIVGPLSAQEVAELLASWQAGFTAPPALAPTAGWNVPLPVFVPARPLPPSLLAAWQPTFTLPRQPLGTAAWNVPLIAFVPFTRPPAAVLPAWQSAFILPPRSLLVWPGTLLVPVRIGYPSRVGIADPTATSRDGAPTDDRSGAPPASDRSSTPDDARTRRPSR